MHATLLVHILALRQATWAVINFPAAIVTACLALTGLLTVRSTITASRRVEFAAMLVALFVGVTMLRFGLQAIGGSRSGIGGLRHMRSSAPRGAVRLARKLWCIRVRKALRGLVVAGAAESA